MNPILLARVPIACQSFKVQGYTLVELIVVILVLSVLSFTAWSKMTDTDSKARIAALASFRANVSATANMAKSMCLTDGGCNPNTANGMSTVEISGQTIYVHFGYPVGWRDGANAGQGSLHGLLDTAKFKIQPAMSDSMRAVYYLESARNASDCRLTYQLSNTNQTPVMTISTENRGC